MVNELTNATFKTNQAYVRSLVTRNWSAILVSVMRTFESHAIGRNRQFPFCLLFLLAAKNIYDGVNNIKTSTIRVYCK